MKYVITGAAGNVSKPLAETLLKAGHQVTVVGRNEKNLEALTSKGATAAIGSVDDIDFLKRTFSGADAVYTMIPPHYAIGSLDAYQELAALYAEAIKSANIKYVVNLSSVGADLSEGVGPVSGLHLVEKEFEKLTDVNVLNVRAGFFYVNFYGNVGMIKGANIIGGNYGDADAKMILVHPNDVAEAAAEELQNLSFKGHSVRYVASDERTTGDVAKVLGSAIGKPGLPWINFSDDDANAGLKQAGVPDGMADKYTEMGRAMRTGIMWKHYFANRPKQLGKTKLEDFAKEFASAF